MFVIFCQQRSGSHFLNSLLNSHPVIARMHGEILEGKRESHGFYPYLIEQSRTDPDCIRPHRLFGVWKSFVASLEDLPRESDGDGTHAARHGAIIMYNQLEYLPRPTMEKVLRRHPVIHLVRKNLLRTHISDYINRNTTKPAHTRAESDLVRITLPPEELLDGLIERNARINDMRALVQPVRHIEVAYEDVRDHLPEVARNLAKFLGIPFAELTTTLKPSNPFPLTTIIENYDEVRGALRPTPFAWMLADEAPPPLETAAATPAPSPARRLVDTWRKVLPGSR